ncbi:CAF1 family ribonuclease [Ancylostoma ceylanicum]|uniref:CAF1 family ribonuclease n=1 Tax=Ancylostoma ceylanicum TaxID=53326 RepID=A0A0D6L4H1_9BILA|nr:CAF1 family ribonuclease [Ancylostoma ceylanicum]
MEVCRTNFNTIWPYLLVSMKSADFIALDLELSGLGSRLASAAKNVADRYAALRDAARTRGILSLGLAFFKKAGQKETKRRLKFQCQVFNILSLCAEPFIVEPEALEFLSKHSFDFNQLIDKGVRYYPSNISKACPLRSLMTELLSRGVPLILHNGLVDLAFLYHHFYSPIPDSQGDNVREALGARWHLTVAFDETKSMMKVLQEACEKVDCPLPDDFPDHIVPFDLKEKYHGFCRKQRQGQCQLIHDVDYGIDLGKREA